jgi:hypothetical protein
MGNYMVAAALAPLRTAARAEKATLALVPSTDASKTSALANTSSTLSAPVDFQFRPVASANPNALFSPAVGYTRSPGGQVVLFDSKDIGEAKNSNTPEAVTTKIATADISATASVDPAGKKSRFLSRVINFLPARAATWLTAGLTSLGLMADAKGVLVVEPSKMPEHLALAAQYEHSVFSVQFLVSGALQPKGSCFLIAPNKVLTEAHVAKAALDSGQAMVVCTGPNKFNNRGQEIPVTSAAIHPDYVDIGTGRDLAILTLAQPVQNGVVIQIGDTLPPIGTVFTIVGFGSDATTSGYTTPDSGNRNASRAPRVADTATGLMKLEFRRSWSSTYSLLGGATPGDSGGLIVGSDGKAYATCDNGSPPGIAGWVTGENLTRTENNGWVQQHITVAPVVPVMPTLTCEISGPNSICLKVQGDLVQAGGRWMLESSQDLESWAPQNSVTWTAGSAPHESSCVMTTSAGRGYFRLTWNLTP